MQLPDQLDGHEGDEDVEAHVRDREAVVHGREVDARAIRGAVVPREGDGLALEEGDEEDDRQPEEAERADGGDGVPEGALREDPAVEEEDGDFGGGDGEGVEEEGGEEGLVAMVSKSSIVGIDKGPHAVEDVGLCG